LCLWPPDEEGRKADENDRSGEEIEGKEGSDEQIQIATLRGEARGKCQPFDVVANQPSQNFWRKQNLKGKTSRIC
jgi:hypothetical protein